MEQKVEDIRVTLTGHLNKIMLLLGRDNVTNPEFQGLLLPHLYCTMLQYKIGDLIVELHNQHDLTESERADALTWSLGLYKEAGPGMSDDQTLYYTGHLQKLDQIDFDRVASTIRSA